MNHVLDSLGIVFPQYWLQDNVDSSFGAHLAILKDAFCQPKHMIDSKGDGTWVNSLLSASHAAVPIYSDSNDQVVADSGSNALLTHSFPKSISTHALDTDPGRALVASEGPPMAPDRWSSCLRTLQTSP